MRIDQIIEIVGRIVMNNFVKYILGLAVVISMVACNSDIVYENSVRVANPIWYADSVARFDIEIADTTLAYQSGILISNSGDYTYQNLWLFVTEIAPDSTIICDTIQYFLADGYGRWLGSGIGSLYTNIYYYKEDLHYSQEGVYTYEIRQGMREDELKGIVNMGMQILRKEE